MNEVQQAYYDGYEERFQEGRKSENDKKDTGCWGCKYLEYYEKDGFEDFSSEGYYCSKRDDDPQDKFKVFPCERLLKCFESKPRADE